MTDKQIIDEERMFECVWCKYSFKESDANFILSENPNECICSGCITEWADNLLCDLKRKEQECEELKKQLETSEEWRIKAEGLNEKLELRNTCYHKALEEIEGYVRDNSDFDKSDTLNSKTGAYDILDIINKAKGEGINARRNDRTGN